MAQNSETFAPNVTQDSAPQTALTAGGVDPMRNAAPQQQQQMGQTVERAGTVMDNIGDQIEWQMDDAKTKMAESQFMQQSMQITHGDGTADNPGYLNTVGQAAISGYDGASAALAKAKQQGLESLDNNFQRQMYNRVATQHLMNTGAVMADHRFRQGTQFATQASDDRATMYGLQASNAWKTWNQTDPDGNPIGNFNTFGQVRDQSVLEGQKQKIGTDDPTTPQNQYALLQARSGTSKTALAQMITSQAPATDVQGFFDAMKAKGYIDPRDEVAMAGAVKSYVVPKTLNDNMNQAFTDAYRANHPAAAGAPPVQGPTDYQGPIRGAGFTSSAYDPDAEGVHITIPANTPVQSPGAGTVSAAGKNDDGVPYVSIEHADGSTSTLTGMSAFNVKAGDSVKMGQEIGTSGDSGNQKNASMLWQLADKNGASIDPTHAGLPPVNIQGITDEKTLEDAIANFRKTEDNPDQQRLGSAQMEAVVRQNQHMQQEAAAQVYSQASDAFYKGGMRFSSIPPTVAAQLTAEQQQKFHDTQTEQVLKQYNQGQAFKTMGETDLVADFIENPKTITPDNVEMARPNLSNSTYLQLQKKAQEFKNSPDSVVEANAVNDRIKYFAAPAGINVHPLMPGDKQTLTNLTYKVNQAIDQIKTQNKGKATGDQVDSAIKNLITQQVYSAPRSSWNPLRYLGSPNTTTKDYVFQAPNGTTHTGVDSNGVTHYLDAHGNILGAAK